MISIIAASAYEVYMILFSEDFMHNIAISSHFFGCLFGVVIGFVVYEKSHRIIRYTFAFVLFYLLTLAVVYNFYAIA